MREFYYTPSWIRYLGNSQFNTPLFTLWLLREVFFLWSADIQRGEDTKFIEFTI